MRQQKGFAVLELVLVVAALAIVTFVVYSASNKPVTQPSPVTSSKTPAKVSKVSDLTTVEAQMNNEELDATSPDETQMDADLSHF